MSTAAISKEKSWGNEIRHLSLGSKWQDKRAAKGTPTWHRWKRFSTCLVCWWFTRSCQADTGYQVWKCCVSG